MFAIYQTPNDLVGISTRGNLMLLRHSLITDESETKGFSSLEQFFFIQNFLIFLLKGK